MRTDKAGLFNMVLAILSMSLFLNTSGASQDARAITDCCGICADVLCDNLESPDKIPQLVDRSTHLFYGIVVLARTNPCCEYSADVTFRVRSRWKGAGGPTITVRTGGGCAGPWPFAIGRWYVVSADGVGTEKEPGRLNDCFFGPLDEKAAPPFVSALDSWRRSSGGSKKEHSAPSP